MPDINLIKGVITRAAISHFPISVLILLTAGQLFLPPHLKKRWEKHALTLHMLCPPGGTLKLPF